jgi:predicted pyridoxine 5'-phosphate oxidase superfamily flavin-nucleotide-binding protein
MARFHKLAFTPTVKQVQSQMGSRASYQRADGDDGHADLVGPDEEAFIAARDSFYMASVGETGWPYVQHRGGPKGFVRVLDDHTLAFADFRGNRQYISVANVMKDNRVALFFMDYPNQTRLKVLAHASLVDVSLDTVMAQRLVMPEYGAKVERAFVLEVQGLDWNCPQHITPRFTQEELRPHLAPIHARLEELERENRRLRERLTGAG